MDPTKAKMRAPAIKDFQDEADFKPNDEISIEPGKGQLLVISRR